MRLLQYILVLTIAFTFFSCEKEVNDVKVGMLLHTTNSSRWSVDLAIIKEKAKERNLHLIIKDANNDENVQLKQAEELVKEGVDVMIVVAASKTTAAGIVRTAHSKGIPVIAYDRLINDPKLDYLVSFDYPMVGEIMIDYVAEKGNGKNSVLLWGDPQDANAIFVRQGHEKALEELNAGETLNIQFRSYVDSWTYEDAKHIVNKVIEFSDVKMDAYICSSINLALAAADALRENNMPLDSICITAQDASLELVHSLLRNEVKMSVLKSIPLLAETALDAAILMASGGKPDDNKTVNVQDVEVPATLLGVNILTKDNIQELLIDDGVFSYDEVYGSLNSLDKN